MKRAIIALLCCLLVLSAGCQKTVTPPEDTESDAVTDTISEQPSDVSEIGEGISDADAIEEELTVGDELDEDFLDNIPW